MISAESDYRSYQQRGVGFQTSTQHQILHSSHGIGLTNWYARPTPHGTVNNGVYIPVRPGSDNTSKSSAQPIIQSHTNVTTSMLKAFQQQALLSNI